MPAPDASDALILTLDIGTSSVRALVFDRQARAISGLQARAETLVRTTADGGVEMDADALFESVAGCIDEVLARAGARAAHIIAVASATLVGNVVGLGANGRPLTPLYTWADTRSASVAAELRAELDESRIHDRTGCLLRGSYLPAQLRWLQRTVPNLTSRVQRWMSIGEYLHLRLFGTTTVSYSVASWSGLLDRRRLVWEPEVLQAAGIDVAMLSPLVDRDQPLQGLLPVYAQRWPVLASIPWFPAIGDGAASSAGCGAVTPERMALALGTSGAVRVMVEHDIPHIPPGLWAYRVDRRRSLLGGALSEGGNLFAWLRETLALHPDPVAVEAELALLPPDGHGLTVLPFLAGERSPGWHGTARATITGLSLHTRPIDVLHAGLEAIGYRFAVLATLARQAAPGAATIIASGGPLQHSSVWLQIICDVLGSPVMLSAEEEATSRGVALLAWSALGQIDDLLQLPPTMERVCQPVSAHSATYQSGAARHQRLYDLLLGDARYETRQ